jgi:hypothetical protein
LLFFYSHSIRSTIVIFRTAPHPQSNLTERTVTVFLFHLVYTKFCQYNSFNWTKSKIVFVHRINKFLWFTRSFSYLPRLIRYLMLIYQWQIIFHHRIYIVLSINQQNCHLKKKNSCAVKRTLSYLLYCFIQRQTFDTKCGSVYGPQFAAAFAKHQISCCEDFVMAVL